MESRIVLELKHGRNNPRNSEGSFVTLADGRIMYAYTRFRGKTWSDHAPADIAARHSEDGGRTWTKRDRILVKNTGECNVMSVSLLRLRDGRVALFYAVKNSFLDCRLRVRTSCDEGRTWTDPVCCIPAPGYFVVNNDRIVQLKSGRIVVPAAYHRARQDTEQMRGDAFDGRGVAVFYLSDDDGATWQESEDWWALPVRSTSGLQEPGVVELKGGSLYCYCRTSTGRQWEMVSRDAGETWTPPKPSRFRSPCSPLSIKRMPATGDLLAVWNDHSGKWELGGKKVVDGWAEDSSWGRTPLTLAISSNEGKTWRKAKLLEDDPSRGFCYAAVHFTDDAALLAYCCGGRGSAVLQDLCIRRVSLGWIYA